MERRSHLSAPTPWNTQLSAAHRFACTPPTPNENTANLYAGHELLRALRLLARRISSHLAAIVRTKRVKPSFLERIFFGRICPAVFTQQFVSIHIWKYRRRAKIGVSYYRKMQGSISGHLGMNSVWSRNRDELPVILRIVNICVITASIAHHRAATKGFLRERVSHIKKPSLQ